MAKVTWMNVLSEKQSRRSLEDEEAEEATKVSNEEEGEGGKVQRGTEEGKEKDM